MPTSSPDRADLADGLTSAKTTRQQHQQHHHRTEHHQVKAVRDLFGRLMSRCNLLFFSFLSFHRLITLFG